jgi:hypothetical protein
MWHTYYGWYCEASYMSLWNLIVLWTLIGDQVWPLYFIFGRPLRCGKASSMLFFSFFFPSLSFLFCVKNKTWHQRRSEEAMGIYLLVNKYRIEEIGRGFFGTDLGLESDLLERDSDIFWLLIFCSFF